MKLFSSRGARFRRYFWRPASDGLWYCDGIWLPLEECTTEKGFSSHGPPCRTLRAFRRFLKKVGRKQPELKGTKFHIGSIYVGCAYLKGVVQ